MNQLLKKKYKECLLPHRFVNLYAKDTPPKIVEAVTFSCHHFYDSTLIRSASQLYLCAPSYSI